ncbi:hypothetical protein ACLOJK_033586 [Asimina triloba]
MEEEAEILEPLLLHFSDLLLLQSSPSDDDDGERKRLASLSTKIMEALGPTGPGLLAVAGVPKASRLRKTLLPLARKLGLLGIDDLRRVLKDHGLGTDVPLKDPNRRVSSFALQLKYAEDQNSEFTSGISSDDDEHGNDEKEQYGNINRMHDRHDYEIKKLGKSFKELGFFMMKLGLCVAKVCDKAIGDGELEQSILESGTAKGRLIHYHSNLDNCILKEARRGKQSTKRQSTCNISLPCRGFGDSISNNKNEKGRDKQTPLNGQNLENFQSGVMPCCRTSISNLWQQWHYDYGIFTVLTSPMFLSPCQLKTTKADVGFCISCAQECSPSDGHTYLQVFDANKNKIVLVRLPVESFIVQVGESADILSKGKLRSSLHSVCRPLGQEELSRETFVVFLQPAWDKILSISEYPITGCKNSTSDDKVSQIDNEKTEMDSDVRSTYLNNNESHKIVHEILNVVPPLSSRLKSGMTFAEFSRATTKQYYGGSGLQSKR